MKIIVAVKPACGRAYNLLRHCYLSKGRQEAEIGSISDDDDRVFGLINGLGDGGVFRDACTDARSLIADLPLGRAQIRHVIISAEDCVDTESRKSACLALAHLVEQFAEKFAPGTPFIGVIHQDRLHPHAHLIFQNSIPDTENALNWNRDHLKEMQAIGWVSGTTRHEFSIEPGRHSGRCQREGTGMPYPLADLSAWKLAAAAITEIEQYESADLLNVHRRKPSGEITSVKFYDRQIRTSTIRNLAAYSQLHTTSSSRSSVNARRNRRMVSYRPPTSPSVT